MEKLIVNKRDILDKAIKVSEAYTYGIYFLLKNNKIVYIGKTSCGIRRMHAHLGYKDFDSFSFFPCSKEYLEAAESENIFKYKPEYNKKISGKYTYNKKNRIFLLRGDGVKKNNRNKKVAILETGEVFNSMTELSKKLKVNRATISYSIRRKNRCKGYTIELLENI